MRLDETTYCSPTYLANVSRASVHVDTHVFEREAVSPTVFFRGKQLVVDVAVICVWSSLFRAKTGFGGYEANEQAYRPSYSVSRRWPLPYLPAQWA